jgi:hypothetical protein
VCNVGTLLLLDGWMAARSVVFLEKGGRLSRGFWLFCSTKLLLCVGGGEKKLTAAPPFSQDF